MSPNAARNSTAREARQFIRFHRRLLAGLAAVVVAAAFLAQAALAGHPAPVVPSSIQVPEGNKVFLVGHGVGVQIYSCNGSAWSFVAPRANLYNDHGKLIITHFVGPTWQAKDGSTAVGRLDAPPVTVDPTAVPWLRLRATSIPGPDGDRLVDTTFIQRTATTGGIAPPAATCTAPAARTVVEVPYTADYFFWKRTGA